LLRQLKIYNTGRISGQFLSRSFTRICLIYRRIQTVLEELRESQEIIKALKGEESDFYVSEA